MGFRSVFISSTLVDKIKFSEKFLKKYPQVDYSQGIIRSNYEVKLYFDLTIDYFEDLRKELVINKYNMFPVYFSVINDDNSVYRIAIHKDKIMRSFDVINRFDDIEYNPFDNELNHM